jgi:hypothetical protein
MVRTAAALYQHTCKICMPVLLKLHSYILHDVMHCV